MGVNNLFRPRKHFAGGGADMGDPDSAGERESRGYGAEGSGSGGYNNNNNNNNNTGQSGSVSPGQSMAMAGDLSLEGMSQEDASNAVGQGQDGTSQQNTTQEEEPGFFQSIFDFFSDLAPTQEEQFAQDWDKLASWEKKKALSQLGITEDQLTGDVMSAFNDYNNMSLSEIQDAISGLSISDLFSNPFDSGTLGVGYSMLDLFNPFTNTQYNLQDMNNWSMEPSDLMGPNLGTYTGNVASLNSAQLADLANQQIGGLTNTQLGQALAGMVNDVETQNANRGPENPPGGNMNDQNVELTESAKQIADLISRGFTEAMAERIVSSGKYFASYDE
tara:strand:+ start:5356 stop:6351 length:996 start_codon:yes stop_codon:yes gene_type:complete